jgi:hypothetical protein
MGAGDLITRLKEHFIVLYNSQLHVLKFHKEIIVIGQDSYIWDFYNLTVLNSE